MADVKQCDQTGRTADSLNPEGWLQVSVRRYGEGHEQLAVQGDVADGDAAVEWLRRTLGEIGVEVSEVEAKPKHQTVRKTTAKKRGTR